MRCSICGREIHDEGHNPFPVCTVEDFDSRCCANCNAEIVIPARITATRHYLVNKGSVDDTEVGDTIVVVFVDKTNSLMDVVLKKGIVESIDEDGTIHGSWGNCSLNAKNDSWCIL